jgi:hypothetical protein
MRLRFVMTFQPRCLINLAEAEKIHGQGTRESGNEGSTED